MKKLSGVTAVLAALMIVLAALGSLCGAVVSKAHSPLFYGSESRAAVKDAMGFASEDEVTAYIGLDWQQQDDLAGALANQMRLEYAEFHLEALNEREQQHMRDVRDLVGLAQTGSQTCTMLAAALAVVIAWTGSGLKKPRKPVLLGIFCGAGVIIFAALGVALAMNSAGFEALFVRFHEIAFTNDLWLLNPETDMLIRMMPQLLFERAAADVLLKATGVFAVTVAMLGVVYTVFSGMIRRHLTERK